jgi:hypothetical protein
MHSNVRPMVSLLRKCALLFLAFFVFSFGLQARLSQYWPSPPNPTASKISTEKHSAQVLKALDKQDESANSTDRLAFALFLMGFQAAPTLQSVTEQAAIRLSDPRRLDLHGVYSSHGPPPTLL